MSAFAKSQPEQPDTSSAPEKGPAVLAPVPGAREPGHGSKEPGRLRRSLFARVVWINALRVLVFCAVVGLWELLSDTGVLDPFFFSRPSDVGVRIAQWVGSGSILGDLGVTLEESLYGFLIVTGIGLGLGFLLARVRLLGEIIDPYIQAFNALPRVILAPIFLLWFGLGITSKVALGVSIVFVIVFFNTYRGLKEVDPVRIANARMLGASEGQLLRHVYLPSALTWIFSSLHVSVGFAIVGAVVGEYLGASMGIGYVIHQSEGTFDTTGVFAGMVVLMVVVIFIDIAVYRIERYLLRWQPKSIGDPDAKSS